MGIRNVTLLGANKATARWDEAHAPGIPTLLGQVLVPPSRVWFFSRNPQIWAGSKTASGCGVQDQLFPVLTARDGRHGHHGVTAEPQGAVKRPVQAPRHGRQTSLYRECTSSFSRREGDRPRPVMRCSARKALADRLALDRPPLQTPCSSPCRRPSWCLAVVSCPVWCAEISPQASAWAPSLATATVATAANGRPRHGLVSPGHPRCRHP